MAFNRIVELYVGPEGQPGVKITGLKVEFDVLKNIKEGFGKAEISVYNLKDSLVQQYSKTDNVVSLNLGYTDEGSRTAFYGYMGRHHHTRNGVDTIWKIEAYDGALNVVERNGAYTFGTSTPVLSIVTKLISDLGYPLGAPLPDISQNYANGWAFIGKVSKGLTKILAFVGLKYMIQNGRVIVYSGTEVPASQLVLSKTTGMLYAPELLEDKADVQGSTSVPKRYKVKSIVYPQAVPGTIVTLQSDIANGQFKIESAHFYGDNWDGDFMLESEVVAV